MEDCDPRSVVGFPWKTSGTVLVESTTPVVQLTRTVVQYQVPGTLVQVLEDTEFDVDVCRILLISVTHAQNTTCLS